MCTFLCWHLSLTAFLFCRVHGHGCIQHWFENRAIHPVAFSKQEALKENNIKVEDTVPILTKHEIKLGRLKHIFFCLCLFVSLSLSFFHKHTPVGKYFKVSNKLHSTSTLRVSACATPCAGFWKCEGEKDLPTFWGLGNTPKRITVTATYCEFSSGDGCRLLRMWGRYQEDLLEGTHI